MASIFEQSTKFLDRFLANQYLSEEEFLRKRVSFYWTFSAFIAVAVLTLFAFIMKVNIIGEFGLVLLFYYLIILLLFGTQYNFDVYSFIFLIAVILTATIYILICGGYLHSGGLIFVGLYCVFAAALFKKLKLIFVLIAIYISSIVLIAVLDPYLTIHPDMTPRNNFIFFVVNTIWMSTSQLFFILYYFKEKEHFKAVEVDQLKELDNVKTKLYTNITHEFRTPLTLILGMADQIQTTLPDHINTIKVLKKNARKLLRLVDQMLSLSKYDSGHVKVNNIHSDLIGYIQSIITTISSSANIKKINIQFKHEVDNLEMDFDPEKIEEVIMNLVANAIQSTDIGGRILIDITLAKSHPEIEISHEGVVQISVKDNGTGIPADKLPRIFDRFYQVEDDSNHHHEGTGIGLAIVKENVTLMGGNIEIESVVGLGTRSIISIPITHKAESIMIESLSINDYSEEGNNPPLNSQYSTVGLELDHLLIIEDNEDMSHYLRALLQDEYQIITAINGIEGLHIARQNIPDIIISDVMMPGMDGFEFLEKIKDDIRTSHIPVIMVTAKADLVSRLEGFEKGAEAYLTKPFNKKELNIRLRKLLEQRKKLQERYLSFNVGSSLHKPVASQGDAFMVRIQELIESNLDKADFGIPELCKLLPMSRTQLYRKFSALTNTTVDKYIRKYRLHKAMEMLKTTELNVTQVAMEVGFSNPSYFSRIFKNEFGYSPIHFSS